MIFFIIFSSFLSGISFGSEITRIKEVSLSQITRDGSIAVSFNEEIMEMMRYLVTEMEEAQEFYFLVNKETDEIGAIVKEIWENKAVPTKIIHYGSDNYTDTWMPTLRRALWPGKVRVVILFLDVEEIIKVFTQVKTSSLESEFVNWVVLSNEPITFRLENTLREGYMVITFEKEKTKFLISRSYIASDNSVRFSIAGYGKCDPKCGIRLFNPPLLQPLSETYRNFGGRRLNVSAVDNWPFIVVYTRPTGKLGAKTGIDFNILEILASVLNFTYDIVTPLDEQWGHVLENGVTTGMIGMVYRREAHLAIDEITILGSREKAVDFTAPYYMEPTTLVSNAPKRKSEAWQTFTPFTLEVWILLCIATVLSGPCIFFIYQITPIKIKRKALESFENYSFEVFRTLLRQDSQLKLKAWPPRVVLLSWFLFSYIVSIFYATTLNSVLVVPSMDKAIDSLEDLESAAENRGNGIILALGTSFEEIFKQASSGIYYELWQHFDPSSGYVVDRAEGLKKVLAGDNTYVNAHLHSEIQATKFGRQKFYLARQTFNPQSYGIACPSGSAYRIIFDETLIRLRESGLISKWSQDIIVEVAAQNSRVADQSGEDSTKGPGALSLTTLQGAFIILGIGFFMSLISFLSETMINKIKSNLV